MNSTFTLITICTATVLGMAALVSLCLDLLLRDRLRIQQRLTQEFQTPSKTASHKSPLFRDLKMLHDKTNGGERPWKNLWARFAAQLEQSGLSWSRVQIVGAALIGASASSAILAILFPQPLVIVAVAVAMLIAPFLLVEFYRQHRRTILCQQLPDAFDQMKRSVRAGQSLATSMRQIALEFPSPIAEEFGMCCQQQDFGLSQAASLQDLARRVSIMELQMFVVAVLVQRDVGGNTAEMLGNLSQVVRQRFRLASRVQALTGEGRMQAIVLALLPFIAGAAMMFLNPEYAQVLLDRPRILGGLFISEIIGVLWIRRIVNFDY